LLVPSPFHRAPLYFSGASVSAYYFHDGKGGKNVWSRESNPDDRRTRVGDPRRGTGAGACDAALRNKLSMRVDAQIDPQGAIKGRYQGPECMVDYVWHKQTG